MKRILAFVVLAVLVFSSCATSPPSEDVASPSLAAASATPEPSPEMTVYLGSAERPSTPPELNTLVEVGNLSVMVPDTWEQRDLETKGKDSAFFSLVDGSKDCSLKISCAEYTGEETEADMENWAEIRLGSSFQEGADVKLIPCSGLGQRAWYASGPGFADENDTIFGVTFIQNGMQYELEVGGHPLEGSPMGILFPDILRTMMVDGKSVDPAEAVSAAEKAVQESQDYGWNHAGALTTEGLDTRITFGTLSYQINSAWSSEEMLSTEGDAAGQIFYTLPVTDGLFGKIWVVRLNAPAADSGTTLEQDVQDLYGTFKESFHFGDPVEASTAQGASVMVSTGNAENQQVECYTVTGDQNAYMLLSMAPTPAPVGMQETWHAFLNSCRLNGQPLLMQPFDVPAPWNAEEIPEAPQEFDSQVTWGPLFFLASNAWELDASGVGEDTFGTMKYTLPGNGFLQLTRYDGQVLGDPQATQAAIESFLDSVRPMCSFDLEDMRPIDSTSASTAFVFRGETATHQKTYILAIAEPGNLYMIFGLSPIVATGGMSNMWTRFLDNCTILNKPLLTGPFPLEEEPAE